MPRSEGHPLATTARRTEHGSAPHAASAATGARVVVSGLGTALLRMLAAADVPGADLITAAAPGACPRDLFAHGEIPSVWLVSDQALLDRAGQVPGRHHPGRPAVVAVMSASAGGDDIRAAMAAGADDVLCMPLRSGELAARVAAAIRLAKSADELRRGEESMRVLSLEEGGLRRITMAIASGEALSEVLHRVAQEAVAILDCDAAHIAMRERDGRATLVGMFRRDEAVRQNVGTHLDHSESATARAIAEGRPVCVSEYEAEGAAAAFGWGSGVAVPVTVRGEVWGALGMARVTPGPAPSGAVRRLGRLAELAALGIGNAQSTAETRRLVVRDHLTGLFNRKQFEETLAGEFSQAARHGYPVSLAILDIDHFKSINDTHGHPAGDAVLVEIARRFARCARAGETVARVGGEEFAIVFPRTAADGAAVAAERFRATVERDAFATVGRVTVSIGVAEAADDADAAVRRADEALYASKTGGRNRVTVFRDGPA